MDERSRRRFLEGTAVVAAVGLGGCGSRGSGRGATGDGRTTADTVSNAATDSSQPYRSVVVDPETQFSVRIGSGERFENVLIDISAEGATFDIEATGSDWVVRNVGIEGIWDRHKKAEPFRASVDRGSAARIENFYFADGAPDDTYPGVTGIYVYRAHAGRLRIDRTNIQDMPDNAIYASTPGYPDTDEYPLPEGGGGVVEITNSYAADCLAAHFRLGTAGSFARNCVAVGGHRGFIGRFEHTRAIDCDLADSSHGDVVVGARGWDASDEAAVTVENCRFETIHRYRDGNVLHGESVGRPRTEPPAGVPRSAEAAASGSSDGDA
jgi:hypothetical protein